MKNLLIALLFLAPACQKTNIPVASAVTERGGDGCESSVVVKSISNVPYTVSAVGDIWCLMSEANDERLIPCDWNWDPQLQVAGTKVLLSGDYPEWTPSPNARYIGRPFKVKSMVKAK